MCYCIIYIISVYSLCFHLIFFRLFWSCYIFYTSCFSSSFHTVPCGQHFYHIVYIFISNSCCSHIKKTKTNCDSYWVPVPSLGKAGLKILNHHRSYIIGQNPVHQCNQVQWKQTKSINTLTKRNFQRRSDVYLYRTTYIRLTKETVNWKNKY